MSHTPGPTARRRPARVLAPGLAAARTRLTRAGASGRAWRARREVGSGTLPTTRGLFLGLALVSLLVTLLDLVGRPPQDAALAGVGALALAGTWFRAYRAPWGTVALDLAEASAFLVVATAVGTPWATTGLVFGSTWFRSLGGPAGRVALRLALYLLGVVVASVVHAPPGDGPGTLLPVSSAAVLTALTAWTSHRLGRALREHDAAVAVGRVQAALAAGLIGQTDSAAILTVTRSAWADVCRAVPGLRMLELDGARVLARTGRWTGTQPVGGLAEAGLPALGRVGALASAPLGLAPELDLAAGERCRWARVPLTEADGRTHSLVVGAGAQVDAAVLDAVTGAVAQVDLALEHASAHAALARRATTDELTGLANRAAFFSALEASAAPVSVLYLDLDEFKAINDRHGHGVGDEVLREAAERLRAACRPTDLGARLGGDELAVLLRDTDAAAAEAVGRRISAALALPVRTSAGEISTAASWGVATATSHETDLLARADEAMYVRKRSRETGRSPARPPRR